MVAARPIATPNAPEAESIAKSRADPADDSLKSPTPTYKALEEDENCGRMITWAAVWKKLLGGAVGGFL